VCHTILFTFGDPVCQRWEIRSGFGDAGKGPEPQIRLEAVFRISKKLTRNFIRGKTTPEHLPQGPQKRIFFRMSIAAEKLAEVLAWPEQDRAFLARKLIASLDETAEPEAETEWNEVIDRRSREMAQGRVDTRSEEEMIQNVRAKLHARRQAS
jgi:hypothetical protein